MLWQRRQKNNGHDRRSTRTSGVTTTYRDRIRQRNPEGIDVTSFHYVGSPKGIRKTYSVSDSKIASYF